MTPQGRLSRRIARGMRLMGMELDEFEARQTQRAMVAGVSISETWQALRPRGPETERLCASYARPFGYGRPQGQGRK